jgi:hypothetical protein
MSFRQYIAIMILITGLCLAGLIAVIYNVDPDTFGWQGLLLFYSALFLSILGIFSVIGVFIRRLFFAQEMEFYRVKNAFRQSFWLGILVVAAGMLQHAKLLSWWNILILIGILAVLEFFFVSYEKSYD